MFSDPIGADVVVPAALDRLAAFRLARLRIAARGRLEIRGRPRSGAASGSRSRAGARVVLEDGCLLGEGCRIEARAGVVRIGAGAELGERAVIVALAGVEIGTAAVVGDWALIADHEPGVRGPRAPDAAAAVHARTGARRAARASARTP